MKFNIVPGMPAYAGIGSRETPSNIQHKMTIIAKKLEDKFTLRSGGAIGADMAFERGVENGNKEIFLHKKNAFGNSSDLYHVSEKALKIAEHFHPVWDKLNPTAKLLMGRNSYQVLGKTLDDPVKLVICYTPDGIEHGKYRTKASGGTAQAISIASYLDIPVINMKNPLWEIKLHEVLVQYGVEVNLF